jgi:hypothetical protein
VGKIESKQKDEYIMMSIEERERSLFDGWREQRPSIAKHFIEDGVVDEERFLHQKCRYVFVLKEANDLGKSLVSFLRNGAPGNGGHTWNPVCRWLTGRNEQFFPGQRADILRDIAAINLKKEDRNYDGGYATSFEQLEKTLERDRDLIRKQLEIYAQYPPVVFVCCGPGLLTMIQKQIFPRARIQAESVLPYMQPDANCKTVFVAFNHPNAKKSGLTEKFQTIQSLIRDPKGAGQGQTT